MNDDLTQGFIYLGIALGVYFLPWIVAMARRHRNCTGIFLLDLLLGWTLIGWVMAIIWAVYNERKQPA